MKFITSFPHHPALWPYCGGTGSTPRGICDEKEYWYRFFSVYFGIPLSVSIQQYTLLIFHSATIQF